MPELERRGHRAIAVELPISNPRAGAAEYAAVVEAEIDPGVAPVLVGHSMGGLVIPLVAARGPVRPLIFLAAMLPKPGSSLADQREAEPIDGLIAPTTAEFTSLGNDVWQIGPKTATELFFHDAAPDLANRATDRLRPQSYRFMTETTPLQAWPSVESDYIVCRADRALNPAWGRSAAHERLGVDALEIEGGHSPFLTRPAELASLIGSLAAL